MCGAGAGVFGAEHDAVAAGGHGWVLGVGFWVQCEGFLVESEDSIWIPIHVTTQPTPFPHPRPTHEVGSGQVIAPPTKAPSDQGTLCPRHPLNGRQCRHQRIHLCAHLLLRGKYQLHPCVWGVGRVPTTPHRQDTAGYLERITIPGRRCLEFNPDSRQGGRVAG